MFFVRITFLRAEPLFWFRDKGDNPSRRLFYSQTLNTPHVYFTFINPVVFAGIPVVQIETAQKRTRSISVDLVLLRVWFSISDSFLFRSVLRSHAITLYCFIAKRTRFFPFFSYFFFFYQISLTMRVNICNLSRTIRYSRYVPYAFPTVSYPSEIIAKQIAIFRTGNFD